MTGVQTCALPISVDYKDSREGQAIRLEVSGPRMPVYFILRVNEGTIAEVSGGTWKEVESQVYLIEANQPEVMIRMK